MRLNGMLAVLVLALVAALAAEPVTRFGPETWFTSDALPQKLGVKGNPLDYCGQRIGLDVRGVELPRAWEGGYRFCCRFPIIDAVANRPLYMKQWTEETADSIVAGQRRGGIAVVDEALQILRGPTGYERLRPNFTSQALFDSFELRLRSSDFTPKYQSVLRRLVFEYLNDLDLVRDACSNLTRADSAFFDSNPGYYLAPDGKKMPELTGDNSTQLDFVDHARRVRYEYVFLAESRFSRAVGEYVYEARGFTPQQFYTDTAKSRLGFEFKLPNGLLRITGMGSDTLTTDAVFQIDLGGDDVYRNNAGGCRSMKDGIALCIDHSGDDQYVSDSNYAQGFGFLGVGMLVDMAGNDRYVARHFSQGAGIMGVGALWDLGGNDVYDAQTFVQGAGMFGLGVLLDDSGDDQYDCASLGQGAATTLGLGILSDLAGDDQYRLAVKPDGDALLQLPGYGQGGALSFRPYPWEGKLTTYGGVGLLVDDRGDDRYESGGWNCQGGSYIMSLGALVDNQGDDHYLAGTGQGSGIHITNSILIDRAGDDVYEGGFRAGGSGGDRSPGFLIDYAGNDTYISHTSSFGTGCKPFCFSLMIDYSGDDRYICEEPKGPITFNNWESFGGIWPESESYSWPYAICMDLGGRDEYKVRHHANNSERSSFGHGIHLDMEWKGGDVIGPVKNPLPAYPGMWSVRGSPLSESEALAMRLRGPDLFARFQAVGRIKEVGGSIIPTLVRSVGDSGLRQVNRDVLECLNYLLVGGQVTDADVPELAGLLKATDPEVRTLMADNFGVFRLRGAEKELAAALEDSVASVRRFALRSLATLKAQDGIARVRELALHDPSEDVRRTAVRCLCRVDDPARIATLLLRVLEADSMASPRIAAAEGLAQFNRQEALAGLRTIAKSPDVYLQRAAGKALAELGWSEGIGLLIESMSFPSIDAFYNYDRNVPNYISAYANFDLPESTRYDQSKWREWFQASSGRIDLTANVAAWRALSAISDSLSAAPDSVQVRAYENLLLQYPDYRRTRNTLAAKLNGMAWNMVTAARGSASFSPAAGLRYARRMVELVDDPNYYDTLIEALLANGLNAEALNLCEQMTKRYPANPLFTDRLKRLNK